MDRDVEQAVEHQNTMTVIKAIGRIVLGLVAIISVASYACERADANAIASKPSCKAYVCTDK